MLIVFILALIGIIAHLKIIHVKRNLNLHIKYKFHFCVSPWIKNLLHKLSKSNKINSIFFWYSWPGLRLTPWNILSLSWCISIRIMVHHLLWIYYQIATQILSNIKNSFNNYAWHRILHNFYKSKFVYSCVIYIFLIYLLLSNFWILFCLVSFWKLNENRSKMRNQNCLH